MAKRDIVVVAASAGGVEALRDMLAGVPIDYPGAILVVLHMPATGGNSLPRILERAGSLPASTAVDGEPLRPGRIYVCSGDQHLLVANGHVHLRRGPHENGHRPAADPLFRSAARYYGPRVVGVVLSGTLSDGTAGLLAVRQRGGITVVQDPADALYQGMPLSAINYVHVDHVVPATEIGPLIAKLASTEVADAATPAPSSMNQEVELMLEGTDEVLEGNHPGVPSPWPCPDCNGVLWAIESDDLVRFRCRVGHAWWPDALLAKQAEAVESALWMALRSLEDRAALAETMAERAEITGRKISAQKFLSELEGLQASIVTIRDLLNSDDLHPAATEAELG
jgi:two-component system, chemotaxis family, protein-glutamate methylesterase/glutaminase